MLCLSGFVCLFAFTALTHPSRHMLPSGECNCNVLPIQCSVPIELTDESSQNGRTDCVDTVSPENPWSQSLRRKGKTVVRKILYKVKVYLFNLMPHIHPTISSLLAEVPPHFLSLQISFHFHEACCFAHNYYITILS